MPPDREVLLRQGGSQPTRPPRPGVLRAWYSICSRHQDYEPNCRLCNRGNWVFEPGAKVSRLALKLAPNLWRKWANR